MFTVADPTLKLFEQNIILQTVWQSTLVWITCAMHSEQQSNITKCYARFFFSTKISWWGYIIGFPLPLLIHFEQVTNLNNTQRIVAAREQNFKNKTITTKEEWERVIIIAIALLTFVLQEQRIAELTNVNNFIYSSKILAECSFFSSVVHFRIFAGITFHAIHVCCLFMRKFHWTWRAINFDHFEKPFKWTYIFHQ